MKKPGYADRADLPENKRIDIIGKLVTDEKKTINVVVDDDGKKVDRYAKKLLTKFPHLIIIEKFKSPVDKTVVLKVGPKP